MSPGASVNSNRSGEPGSVEWALASDARLGFRERLDELWRYRRILWFFAVKSVQQLYAKTRLGPVWLLVRPLAPILAASLVFGRVLKVQSEGVPYFLFLLTGSTIWNFFDGPLIFATRGLESNRQLLTKLYLPRLILPAGQMAAGLVEPLVCIAVMIATLAYYRVADGVWYAAAGPRLLVALVAVAMSVVLAFAICLWTSVWQARARDTRFVLTNTLGLWYLLTPIVYPASSLPPMARWAAFFNPMTGPVEAFKWAMLGIGVFPSVALVASTVVMLTALTLGLWYFTRVEAQTIDKL